MYTAAAAALSGDARGWRVPGKDDWDRLVKELGGPAAAYTALAPGGSLHFDGYPGGFRDTDGTFNVTSSAFFWMQTPVPGADEQYVATLSGSSSTVVTNNSFDPKIAIAVRYVRDAA